MNMNEWQIYQKHASFKHPASSSLPSSGPRPPPYPSPTPPIIFYSLTRGEFNKYMQMCAVEHDECKSGEDVLWALPRLRLRADPGLIIFHFPIAFNSAAATVHARVCLRTRVHCTHVRMCAKTKKKKKTIYSKLLCTNFIVLQKRMHLDSFNDFFVFSPKISIGFKHILRRRRIPYCRHSLSSQLWCCSILNDVGASVERS